MKENDGKASAKRLQQKVIIALSSTASFLFVLHFFGILPRQKIAANIVGGRGEQARLDALRRLGQTKFSAQKSEAKKKDHSHHKTGGRGRNGILSMKDVLADPSYDFTAKEQVKQILSASTNLISIDFENDYSLEDDSYSGIVGVFCPLDFEAQKDHPPELPMFKDVVRNSDCNDEDGDNIIKVDLREAVEMAREFDMDVAKQSDKIRNGAPTVLDLKGVVFHESRCGSTLAANSMMALNPEKHRVYSESAPPVAAIKACGEDYSECSVDASANLLKDVIYLMARSDDSREEHLFFKFQSITTRNMASFRKAFPETPWIFLYREPVQVMMSQLDMPKKHIPDANCVRSRKSSAMVRAFVQREGYDMKDLSYEEFCAIHLATLCEAAMEHLEEAKGLGWAVKYSPDLVHVFLDSIFPKHFKVPVDGGGRERVLKVSGTYSKNRGQEEEGAFEQDSEKKEKNASQDIRDASKHFLQPSYDLLGASQYNVDNM